MDHATTHNRDFRCDHGDDGARSIFRLGDDLLQVVLSKLPAAPFAFACATCRTFSKICARVLSRPKLLSAFSANPIVEKGVEETLTKLLSEPIRPHFAIAYVDHRIKLKKAGEIMMKQLGKTVPIICCRPNGVVGRDVETGELKNAIWNSVDDQDQGNATNTNSWRDESCGVLVTLGFVPGLKVKIYPLFVPKETNHESIKHSSMIHQLYFLLDDVQDFASSISGSTSPLGIWVFTREGSNTRCAIEVMDYVFDENTLLAGFEGCQMWFASGDSSNGFHPGAVPPCCYPHHTLDVLTLVFAKEKEKIQGKGEIYFSLAVSPSLAPLGLSYKAIFNKSRSYELYDPTTYLSAKRDGSLEIIGERRIIDDAKNSADKDKNIDMVYCGVLKQSSIKARLPTYYTFHAFTNHFWDDREFFCVEGKGIKTDDALHIFAPSSKVIRESRKIIVENFKKWKVSGTPSWNSSHSPDSGFLKDQVFGGLMCASLKREKPEADSLSFIRNFPNATFVGNYSNVEIVRGHIIEEEYPSPCRVHTCASTYFLMSYAPPFQGIQ